MLLPLSQYHSRWDFVLKTHFTILATMIPGQRSRENAIISGGIGQNR
jgi:hypothetical protein